MHKSLTLDVFTDGNVVEDGNGDWFGAAFHHVHEVPLEGVQALLEGAGGR